MLFKESLNTQYCGVYCAFLTVYKQVFLLRLKK
ncbi:MAG: hypothetical protein ACI8PB_000799 [Desulforhopalus sp.]|jgi:hypothetical protein